MDVREQRVQFVVAAVRKEKPFRTLCTEFGVSPPTGWLWVKRYLEQGIEGISKVLGRRPVTILLCHQTPPQHNERHICRYG